MNLEQVTKLDNCVACGSDNLIEVLNLGTQPLANSYKKTFNEVQPVFPLIMNRCEKCSHLQLSHQVDPSLMFKDYLYVTGTSDTMRAHCDWFANFVTEYRGGYGTSTRRILDVGSNDGTQLSAFAKLMYEPITIGVDPASNLAPIARAKGHVIYEEFFNTDFVYAHEEREDSIDVITAQNVFAHNSKPLDFLHAAKRLLRDDGLIFIQTSQADMIQNNEFDTIYHEHVSYFCINSMNELCKLAGLVLLDVTKCPLHGNSFIFVIGSTLWLKRDAHIANLIDMECRTGYYDPETYVQYAAKCKQIIEDVYSVTEAYRTRGYHLIGYGAAAKGNTLLNASKARLDWIADDNAMKQGTYTPGSSIPIMSPDIIKSYGESEKIMFVPLAWNFFTEISGRIKKLRDNPKDVFLSYFPEIEIK